MSVPTEGDYNDGWNDAADYFAPSQRRSAKLREAATQLISNWLTQEPGCTVAAISNDLRKLSDTLEDKVLAKLVENDVAHQ